MRREAFTNDGITPYYFQSNAYDLLVWDTTRYTDWQKVFISFSGLANGQPTKAFP